MKYNFQQDIDTQRDAVTPNFQITQKSSQKLEYGTVPDKLSLSGYSNQDETNHLKLQNILAKRFKKKFDNFQDATANNNNEEAKDDIVMNIFNVESSFPKLDLKKLSESFDTDTDQVPENLKQMVTAIESLCHNLKNESKKYDLDIQNKISEEVNKGRIQIKAQDYIKDQQIMKKTNFQQSPQKHRYVQLEDEDDLPEDRELIDFGHESFDIVFNIMLGIKRSIDCIFHSPFNQIQESDYTAEYAYKNEWYSARESQSHTFKFIDIAPKVFEDIRVKDGISNSEYIDALGPNYVFSFVWTNNLRSFTQLVSSGKSGALFYYTPDGKFMLKTIAKPEYDKLFSTLEGYHKHLIANPDSLMTRYYGLHKIRYTLNDQKHEQYIIIMNNMFRNLTPDIKYDLKGSTVGRTTTFKDGKIDYKISFKDLDFINDQRKIKLTQDDLEKVLMTLRSDSSFLGKSNLHQIYVSFLII